MSLPLIPLHGIFGIISCIFIFFFYVHHPPVCECACKLNGHFYFAGEHLKEKYEGAIEVRATRRGRLQIRDPRFSLPTASDLVYIDDSPNYCIRNITAGSIGITPV